jgi:hypothetical protein
MRTIFSTFVAVLVLGLMMFAQDKGKGGAKGGGKAKAAPTNLKILTPEGYRPMMDVFVASLGVADQGGCLFCHTMPGQFASDDNPRKDVARKMLLMVKNINDQTFGGEQEVTCYTCHRGSTHPLTQAP